MVELPDCEIRMDNGKKRTAYHDAKTIYGSWCFLCKYPFQKLSYKRLGAGVGQLLILRKDLES